MRLLVAAVGRDADHLRHRPQRQPGGHVRHQLDLAARHCGLKVAAVSAITNLAEGLSPFALSHEQTLKYAAIAAKDMVTLIHAYIERLGSTPRADA